MILIIVVCVTICMIIGAVLLYFPPINLSNNNNRLLCKIFGHSYCLKNRSNTIQFDTMGNPLRLFIVECDRCGKSKMMWIDSAECKKDVILKWSDEYESGVPIPPSTNEEE